MYVNAGTVFDASWAVNFVRKQSKRDSAGGSTPAGSDESYTSCPVSPFTPPDHASFGKQWPASGGPRSELANFLLTSTRSAGVRSLSGNNGMTPATASPKLK